MATTVSSEPCPCPPVPGTPVAASVAASLVVLVCVAVRMPDHVLRVTGIRGWAPALVGVMTLVIGARTVAQAPFTFVVRATSISKWISQQFLSLTGAIAVGAALTVPLYALIRATPLWWLGAWVLFAAVSTAAVVAMPLIVRVQTGRLAPAPAALAERVAAIATRAGVELGGGVLLAGPAAGGGPMRTAAEGGPMGTASGRGPRCNAFVVGCGPTRRVVLETGVAAWPADLLDQVVAHEIGHCRLRHVTRRLPVTLAVQLATFALAGAAFSFRPLLRWAGVAHLGDPRSYPLMLALTAVIVLPARVVLAAYDRSQERQADAFALELLGDPRLFAAMLDRAATEGQAPSRLPWWRYSTASHPPIAERILACQPFLPTARSGDTLS